jgi:hypothetical protein
MEYWNKRMMEYWKNGILEYQPSLKASAGQVGIV